MGGPDLQESARIEPFGYAIEAAIFLDMHGASAHVRGMLGEAA
jgi:hypothetical protein